MSVFGLGGGKATLETAKRYIESLEALLEHRERVTEAMARRIGDLEATLEKERKRRVQAEKNAAGLERRLSEMAPDPAAGAEEIVELEERVAELELDKRVLERRLERATSEVAERADQERDGDGEAIRQRVLRQQAVRARLAKTDMSAWARLQTLKQAQRIGVELDDDQEDELRELQREYE